MMRHPAGTLVLGFALLLLPAAAEAQEAETVQADIAGVYFCNGTGADGEAYRGLVTIEPQGDTFYVQWAFASELTAVGIGILHGDALAVTYFGSAPGLVLYRVDGERLVGKWTQPGSEGTLFSETLTPVPAGHTVEPEPAPEREQPPRRTRPSGRPI